MSEFHRPRRPHGVFIVGGGTGGHVVPALSIASALVETGVDPAAVHFLGSRRGMEATRVPEAGFSITLLPGRGILRRISLQNVGALAGLALALVRSIYLVARWRPSAVVSVGGYAALPGGLAAVIWRRPLVVVNPDAVPGAANRLLGRWARASAVALAGTDLPRAVVTGVPLRPEVLAMERTDAGRARARGALGLEADRLLIAVTGGSLGARRLNEGALGMARLLADRGDLSIVHVCGERSFGELALRVGELPEEGLVYRLVAFEAHIPELYCAADLVIARAGAITVAELATIGTPSLLVPLPNAPGDHQRRNAEALADAGAAVVIPDGDATPERLVRETLTLLGSPSRLAGMGESARHLARPDAARRIAELVRSVARAARKSALFPVVATPGALR